MRGGPLSFEIRTEHHDRVVARAIEQWKRVNRPQAGILFVSGRLVPHLTEIASALADALAREPRGGPSEQDTGPLWLVAGGHGVLTERAELERQSAATGLVLQGATPIGLVSGPQLEAFAERVGEALQTYPNATAVTLVRADRFEEDMLEGLTPALRKELGLRMVGGGTVADHDVFLCGPGKVEHGPGAALLLRGFGPARIVGAGSCRLLGPLEPITRARGSMVLQIGAERALDVLSRAGEGLEDQPLLLMAVAASESSQKPPSVLIRPIQGVDPTRGGVLVGDVVRPGVRVAFAVRDAHAARSLLTERLRQLSRSGAGSAPRFGIYINCAGRGTALYGAPDVDTKLLRTHFEDVPLVGLQTAFELAPFDDDIALQLYTGVLALFSAPS